MNTYRCPFHGGTHSDIPSKDRKGYAIYKDTGVIIEQGGLRYRKLDVYCLKYDEKIDETLELIKDQKNGE
jgi:hypothetical protein